MSFAGAAIHGLIWELAEPVHSSAALVRLFMSVLTSATAAAAAAARRAVAVETISGTQGLIVRLIRAEQAFRDQ